MLYVEQLFKVMLIPIFTALIAGSIQDVLADTLGDEYKPVLLRNSEYQVHLQVIVRDADGVLISVTEATHGHYIPHEITDEAFDYCFGPSICKNQIVVIDNKNMKEFRLYKSIVWIHLYQRCNSKYELSFKPRKI